MGSRLVSCIHLPHEKKQGLTPLSDPSGDRTKRGHPQIAQKTRLQAALLRARLGAARFGKDQRRQNGGASPFDWRRHGGIGRNAGSCGSQPGSEAALARLWILPEFGGKGR